MILIRKSKRPRCNRSIGGCLGFRRFTSTSELLRVLALLPLFRDSALAWSHGVVKNCIKLRVVHINFNLGEARSITINRVGEHHIARHKLGFFTSCHTFLDVVCRNPANLGRGLVRTFTFDRVFTFPALLHLESDSLIRARNNGDWVLLEKGASLTLSQGDNAVCFILTTRRSRRRSSRRGNARNIGRSSGRAFGGSNGRSSGGNVRTGRGCRGDNFSSTRAR
jgi:uncharacterized membrane protein YgcG